MQFVLSNGKKELCILIEEIERKYNMRKSKVIVDTLTTGPEMRIIIEKMIEWKKAGKSFEEISSDIKAYVDSTRLFFAFKSLHNLRNLLLKV